MKFAISQPMANKTTEEILNERLKVKNEYERKGWEFIDTLLENKPESSNEALWCLSESLKRISTCDCVIFIKGWENARGCKIENMCCKAYGIKTIELD